MTTETHFELNKEYRTLSHYENTDLCFIIKIVTKKRTQKFLTYDIVINDSGDIETRRTKIKYHNGNEYIKFGLHKGISRRKNDTQYQLTEIDFCSNNFEGTVCGIILNDMERYHLGDIL